MPSSQWYEDPEAILTELRQERRVRSAAPRLPGYDDIREHRRGGQGIVYTAVQRSTRRRVAIKVLLQGGYASGSERRRFEREVDVVSGLRHPNIVSIYDSGVTDDGRLYLVMEFVEGMPLDEYAAGRARPETLELFATVCEAVQYAQQRGVIHRDLKPGNIRVDSEGCPRILDFGLAKTNEPAAGNGSSANMVTLSAMTTTGQFLGSLPWVSPEQAEGRNDLVDVRTDVYALGVMLYQMTTGRFPYSVVGSLREALTNILNAEPVRPAAVTPDFDEDLETIILRCLKKPPEERYQSAGELARDIRHYLAGEPIEARRDSAWYMVRKSLRRHRFAAATLFSVAGLTIIYAVTMSVLYGKTQAALSAEEQARRTAQQETQKANSTRLFLEEMLQSADPAVAQGQDVSLLRNLLDRAAVRVQNELAAEPEVQASLRNTIGQTYMALGLHDEAEAHLTAALEKRQTLLGEEHPDTLNTLHAIGTLHYNRRQPGTAENVLRKCYEARARALGPEHVESLATLSSLATAIADQARLQEAEAFQMQALKGIRAAQAADPRRLLSVLNNAAGVLLRQGKLDEAEPLYREAVERSRAALGDRHPETIISLSNLANLLQNRSRHTEAEPLLRDAVETSRAVWGPEHPRTLVCVNNLGHSLQMQGKLEEAETAFREVYEARRRTMGEQNADTLLSMNNLATVIENRGRPDEAEELLRKALAIRRSVLGESSPDVAASLNNLAFLLQKRGQLAEAEPLLRQALEINRRVYGSEHPETLRLMNNLAVWLQSADRLADAEPLVREAYEVKLRVLGEEHVETIIGLYNLAHLVRKQGKPAEAEPLYRRCLEICARTPPADSRLTPQFKAGFGQCLLELGKQADAESVLLEAYRELSDALGSNHERTRMVAMRLAELYDSLQQLEKAAEWRGRTPSGAADAVHGAAPFLGIGD